MRTALRQTRPLKAVKCHSDITGFVDPTESFAIHLDRFPIGSDGFAIHTDRFLIHMDCFSDSYVGENESASRAKLCQEQFFDFSAVVGSAGGNAEDRQRSDFEDSIHIAIASHSVGPLVRRIIKLNGDQWREPRITNHKVDMLRFYVFEIRRPKKMTLIGVDQISQPDFCHDSVTGWRRAVERYRTVSPVG